MLWIILTFIYLQTVESKECNKREIIIGQLGKELKTDVTLSYLREKLNQYIINHDVGKFEKEIKIRFQNMESDVRFKNNMKSRIENLILGQKEISLTNDTVMIKINRTTEGAGVYWIEFDKMSLGQNASTISGGTKYNFTSLLQLECDSVSTSVGDCLPTLYIVWYKNGKRISDVDPISSHINVTVDQNGGNFTCLATEYFPRNDGLPTPMPYDVNEECGKIEIIVGRQGKELLLSFQLSDVNEEYNKYITEHGGKRIIQNETRIHDLKQVSIQFKNKMHSLKKLIFKDGKPTFWTSLLTQISIRNNAIMVKKTKLQKEDAGIYLLEFGSIRLGQKALIIAGKPTITGRSSPNPVLKPEDNYNSIIQLECDSVSTSVGDCLLSLYVVWYTNGTRMTGVDPISFHINVTVDQNGGNFTCRATDYPPCYKRLQTTTNLYDDLNIEECNNVSESEIFIIKPQFAPMDVKLDPDQREITVNKNEDLEVRCSAKCHPKCDVRWGKHFQGLKSSDLIHFKDNKFEHDLVIKNVNSSYEGVYVCLVNNTHGEVMKSFTLSIRETEDKAVEVVIVIAVIVIAIVIIVAVVVVVFIYKRFKKEKLVLHSNVVIEEGSDDDGIYESVIDLHQDESLPEISTDNDSRNGEPGTPTDNDSRNGEPGIPTDNDSRNGELGIPTDNDSRNGDQNTNPESRTYDALEFNIGNRNHGIDPDPVSGYTRLSKKSHRKPKPLCWYFLRKKVESTVS